MGLLSSRSPVPLTEAQISSRTVGGAAIQSPASNTPGSGRRALVLFIATGAGSGYSPFAPGTAGSAVGAAMFWVLSALSLPLYAATVVGITAIGIWAADEAERLFGRKDDGRIVIDEIAGQLITLAPLLWLGRAHEWAWIVTGFVVFRVFDVWKPGPVRMAERNLPGGAGVVLDDVVAGLLAALTMEGLIWGMSWVVAGVGT